MESLGIQPLQIMTQIINFVLLFILLNKFLYKPITKALRDRAKKIEEGIMYSDKMKSEFEKSEKKKTEIIDRARAEAKTIIEEAKKTARIVDAEALEKTKKEAETLLAKAQKEALTYKKTIDKDTQKQSVELAQAMTQKILDKLLNNEKQQIIINKMLKELEATI